MEPGGVQPAPTQGQDVQVPSGQELGPEATAHHLYLTDVRAKRGAPTTRPPRSTDSGSKRVQCWQAGGHCCPGNPKGQLFPLAQASPSLASSPFPFSHLHRKNKAELRWSMVSPQSVPPKSLSHPPGRRAGEPEEMLHRWRPCPWWVQA